VDRATGVAPTAEKPSQATAEPGSEAGEVGASETRSTADTERSSAPTDSDQATTEAIVAPVVPGHSATIECGALEALIRGYCREAGVRNLQKHIEKICRKLAMKVVERKEVASCDLEPTTLACDSDTASNVDLELCVSEDKLSDYVGKPQFMSDRLYEDSLPAGTVTGLAWTALGGSVLYMEAIALPKRDAKSSPPALSVTGQLGSVMKESSQLALLLARRQLSERAPNELDSFFDEHELHLHCPEGSVPKDGPSAGVTMVTSLLSLGLDRPVRSDLAMTGEVSLNGKVLPVGGIKEKTIAARRAGCHVLVFPHGNRRDFDELPEYLREGLEVHYASEYNDVFRVAFADE